MKTYYEVWETSQPGVCMPLRTTSLQAAFNEYHRHDRAKMVRVTPTHTSLWRDGAFHQISENPTSSDGV
jgi:hypothetical protein